MSPTERLACRSSVRALFICLALVSCSESIDASGPDFSECDDGRAEPYCPGMLRETCRLEVLRRLHADGCVSDEDCVLVAYSPNCISHGLCEPRPSVLASLEADYIEMSDAELEAYCAPMTCRLGGSCAPLDTRAACVEGSCTTVIR